MWRNKDEIENVVSHLENSRKNLISRMNQSENIISWLRDKSRWHKQRK